MERESQDKRVLKEIAYDQLLAHKWRNLIMGAAILLTALLLSFVFTAGVSFLTTMQASSEAAPGPGEDGAIIGTKKQYELIRQNEEIKWADFVQICSTLTLRNDEFVGIETRLLAPDEGFYLHNNIAPKTGSYPQTENEIMISNTMADKLKIEQIGIEYPLRVMKTGEKEEEDREEIIVPMKICGIYQNPIANLSDIYEEIYTVPEFIDFYNPELEQNHHYIYVKLNSLHPLLMKSDVYDKLENIRQGVGAEGVIAKHYNNFIYALIALIPAILLIFLIMLSGYFLIYNVFSISIATDIKWFGMMKTIGTTQKQLRYIYKYQIGLLSVVGIAVGVLIGYIFGSILAPGILAMTSYAIYFQRANPVIVILFTILFTWLTIQIGISRTIRKVASLSPIEAAKYVPHRRKKMVTVISFALSGIVFLAVGNTVFGYQTAQMVERYHQEESNIWHIAKEWELEEEYQPITAPLCRKLEELPFMEKIDIIYMARTEPDTIIRGGLQSYASFLGEVRVSGKLKTEVDAISKVLGTTENMRLTENGNIKLEISGLPASRMESEIQYVKILEGELNTELFASGDYILYQSLGSRSATKASIEKHEKIHAGDTLTLYLYDDLLKDYVQKTVEVMAVMEWDDPYSTGNISSSNIVLLDQSFKEIYPDYEERISAIEMVSSKSLNMQEVEQIESVFKSENNRQLRLDSRYETTIYYTNEKKTILLIGLFFSTILGTIGISNFINTLIMDTVFKRNQITVIQSIGMTKKQLRWMLFAESIKISCASMAIILPFGLLAASVTASMFTGFNAAIFAKEYLSILLSVFLLDGILAYGLTEWLNKK